MSRAGEPAVEPPRRPAKQPGAAPSAADRAPIDVNLGLARVSLEDEQEHGTRKLDLDLVRRVFAFTRPHARKRNALLLLVVARSIQLPILTWSVGAIISGPVARRDARATVLSVLGFALFALVTAVVFHFRARLALELGEAVVFDMRDRLERHLLRMPMSFFVKTKVGRLIGRMTSDIDAIRVAVQDVVFVSTVQLGTMAVAMALMAHAHWPLFLVVVAMVPVFWGLIVYFHRRLGAAHQRAQESFSRVTATLAESVTGVRVTQGFVRQDINGGLFRALIFDHSRYNMDAARHSAAFLPLLEFNGQLFLAVLVVVGGYQALGGAIDLRVLVEFFFLANLLFNPIPVLGNQYNQALTAMAGAERLFRVLDREPDWPDERELPPLPPVRGRVALEGVHFAYDPGKPVLHGIDLVAEPGQMIALVGHTGSGKSSILNLLAKLYRPTAGSITIDGHDLAKTSSASLRAQLGLVLQSNFLFSGTVLDNVRLGNLGATEAAIRDAARSLDVLDLLDALPDGLHTEVGERGTGLSLGQRQIVCFLRAMVAEPRIVLLDEATSSVDALTEARLQAALGRLLRGRTSFVVAHRLSTIRHADRIVVLDHGRLVEQGTHAELLARGGVFAALHRELAHEEEPRAALATSPQEG
ncbi:ABC transporter [Sorangium cellulosum]|uniref:ABC transporter n=1 Tax=Sorangium cellulosum TaxID=56 RepID=A0A2L0EIH4_SORCE|nr:ABC transporter ATP-binding protein [Sorangium cellulosum]AUX39077.1 ABC transporter [Sorangium cellulosum]